MILRKVIVSISTPKLLDTYYICTSVGLLLSPAATRKCEFMLFWTGFSRVLSEANSHFIWTLCGNSPTDQCVQRPFPQQVKSIINSHLKEEALLTVHSQILNRLRPPYLVVVSDSNNNTGNCSARKLSIHWWSESVMQLFSRIEKKGNLLLLDNKKTKPTFPSYISHFIP